MLRKGFLPIALSALLAVRVSAQEGAPRAAFLPSRPEASRLFAEIDSRARAADWEGVVDGLVQAAEFLESSRSNVTVASGGGLSLGLGTALRRYADRLPAEALGVYRSRLDGILGKAWKEAEARGTDALSLLRWRIIRDYPQSSLYRAALEEELDVAVESGWYKVARQLCARWIRAADERWEAKAVKPEDRARVHLLARELCSLLGDPEGAKAEEEQLERVIDGDPSGAAREFVESRRKGPRASKAAPGGLRAPEGEEAAVLTAPSRRPADLRPEYSPGCVAWEYRPPKGPFADFVRGREAETGEGRVPIVYQGSRRGDFAVFRHQGLLVAVEISRKSELWTAQLPVEDETYDGIRAPLVGERMVYDVARDRLYAFSRSDGRLLWQRRFEYDPQRRDVRVVPVTSLEPEGPTPVRYALSPAAFLDSVPSGRLVLAVAVREEQEVPTFLVCLESNGTIVWTTFLGSARSAVYLGLGDAGSPPAPFEAAVYHVTNTGIAAAVDAVDGTILWLYEYPRLNPAAARSALRTENRWHTNPVAIAGKTAIIAPRDSALLLGLDLTSGEMLWSCPRQGGSVLAGADDRACYVYGSEVLAVDHSSRDKGLVLWRTELPGQIVGRALGRGFLNEGVIFVPAADVLYRVSAADGRILSRALWGYSIGTGNLTPCGDFLALDGLHGCFLFGDAPEAEAEFARVGPQGPEALLRKAEFRLRRLEVRQALEALESWEKLEAPQPPANSSRGRLQLDVAELARQIVQGGHAPQEASELLRYRLALEILPARRVAAAMDLGLHLEARGDPQGALEAYAAALRETGPGVEYSPRPPLALEARFCAVARMRALRSAGSPASVFRRFDEAAEAALAAARERDSVPAYEEVARLFPFSPAGETAAMEAARRHIARGNSAAALAALSDYWPEGPPSLGPRLLLVQALADSGLLEASRRLRERLLRAHSADPIPDPLAERPGETVAEYFGRIPESQRSARKDLRFPVRMRWRSPADVDSVGRDFLDPEGEPPERLKRAFLVQSLDAIECRDLDTGLPIWKLKLNLVPGFRFRDTGVGFRFPRRGASLLRGRYVGESLVLYDDLNIFAVDTTRGVASWHVPAGSEASGDRQGTSAMLRLRERILGAGISEAGAFVVMSAGERPAATLHRFSPSGEARYKRELPYEPAPRPLSIANGAVFVHSSRPPATFFHDLETGEQLGKIDWPEAVDKDPVEVPGGRLLVSGPQRVHLLDLPGRKALWSFGAPGSGVHLVVYHATAPEECLVVLRRTGKPPALISLGLGDGRELWRYEEFAGERAYFFLARDGNEIFVLAGEQGSPFEARWELSALRVLAEASGGRPAKAERLWPNPLQLGNLLGNLSRHRLHLAPDSLLVSDPPAGLAIYDRRLGVRKAALESPIAEFLVEKGEFSSDVREGLLILLSSAGDCAFEEQRDRTGVFVEPPLEELVRAYIERPSDVRTLEQLALRLFREGKLEGAVALLDEALASEVTAEATAEEIYELECLLQGFREERMKMEVPRIICRRAQRPPAIDGALFELWDAGSALRLNRPAYVRRMPGSTARERWEGEEDLSATIYTAWDEKYFYVAMDVSDDSLYPYDRDAENWRGDCLLIGLDPEGDGGYMQRGNDQLMTLALTLPRRGEKGGEEGEGEGEETKPEGLYSVKKKDDDSGAIYEFGIPWSSFSEEFKNKPPPRGYAFGLSLLLLDDDTGQGAEKALSLNPCHLLPRAQKSYSVSRYLIPLFFPRVVLE